MSIVWATPSAPVTLSVNATANRATYKSGGIDVPAFFAQPQGNGPFPALLVVHGGAGLGREVSGAYVSSLATQGYVVLAPDYFTPIGLGQPDASFYTECIDPAREILGHGLESLKSLPHVDPKRIGVVGFSLGGYMSFILATRDDVKGVVIYYGTYPTRGKYQLGHIVSQVMAPLLILHGDADDVVPIALVNAVRDLLTYTSKQFEFIIYPGESHVFDAEATADARQKMLAFFKAKLQ